MAVVDGNAITLLSDYRSAHQSDGNQVEEYPGSILGESESSERDLIQRVFEQWDNGYKPYAWPKAPGLEDCQD